MIRPLLILLALAAVLPPGIAGQVPDSAAARDPVRPRQASVGVPVQDSALAPRATPRSAMIRSFALPGWGQAQYDAYFRGSIYFAGWAGNWFMLFRTSGRLGEARASLQLRRDQIETALIEGSPNPDSTRAQIDSFPEILEMAVDGDEKGRELQGLVQAREDQREDWIAWSLFWLLASGIDAYVTGHLSDFPAEVEMQPNRDGSVTLQLQVPLPARRE
jgi:hypothetical protein